MSFYRPPPVRPPLPQEYFEQQRLSRFPPTGFIASPQPQHLPSHIPANELESKASEINAVPPYSPQTGRLASLSLQDTSANYAAQADAAFGVQPPPSQFPPRMMEPKRVHSASGAPMTVTGQTFSSRLSALSTPPNAGSRPLPVPQRPTSAPDVPRLSTSASMPSHLNSSLDSTSNNNGSMPMPRQRPRASESGAPKIAQALPTSEDIRYMKDDAYALGDLSRKVRWAKEVFRFLERNQSGSTISDPTWVSWVDEAVRVVVSASNAMPPIPEALFLKADLGMSGTFPTIIPKDPKKAFRDFEAAANAEYAPAWYRIGREYETFNDLTRAKDAYERGMNLGDVTCTYRLGMACLLGQLLLEQDVRRGLEHLRTAAVIAEQVGDPETAAPLYVWAMILAGEFEAPGVVAGSLPRDPTDAGRYMKRAAYLCHPTAQYKVGWAYEHAQLGMPFDPFMSVQYYSLASKEGDVEADMALSKWFLCGAEKCFPANEELAYTFASKAAAKGLATAEFAMGYYSELGLGTTANLDQAMRWYSKAAASGNEDAGKRLRVIEQSKTTMSRSEHEAHAAALVRKRTQARIRSDQENRRGARTSSVPPQDHQRRQTLRRAEQAASVAQQPPSRLSSTPPRAPSGSLQAPQPTQPRYSLSDSPAPQAPAARPAQQAVPIKKGPQSFAEMGIQTTNLKKEECIIC